MKIFYIKIEATIKINIFNGTNKKTNPLTIDNEHILSLYNFVCIQYPLTLTFFVINTVKTGH